MKTHNCSPKANQNKNPLSTPKTVYKQVFGYYTATKEFNSGQKNGDSARQTCQSLPKNPIKLMKSYHLKNNPTDKCRQPLFIKKQSTEEHFEPFKKVETIKENLKIDLKLYRKQNESDLHCEQNIEAIWSKTQRIGDKLAVEQTGCTTVRKITKGLQIQDIILGGSYYQSKNKQQLPKGKIIKLKRY